MGLSPFDPVFGLLSALTSLPAALYYARAIGAAAVHPVRGKDGRMSGLRRDADWMRTLVAFVVGTALAATAAPLISMAFGYPVSKEAAFGAVLIAALWPHAHEHIVRAVLILLLLGAGAARVALEGESPASVGAGFALGLCGAWMLHRAGLSLYSAVKPH